MYWDLITSLTLTADISTLEIGGTINLSPDYEGAQSSFLSIISPLLTQKTFYITMVDETTQYLEFGYSGTATFAECCQAPGYWTFIVTEVQYEQKNKTSDFEPSLTVLYPSINRLLLDDTIFSYFVESFTDRHSNC